MTPLAILTLYVAFRLKQFSCDFLFQSDWMALNKGKPGREGYKALFTHTAVHGLGTTLILLALAPQFWWLGPVDFALHALVDRLKGVFTYKRGWTYTDRWFWWSFGMDQEAHNFTHLAYILMIVAASGGVQL